MTRKQKYFVKQKLIGLTMVILGFVFGWIGPFYLITAPIGLSMMFTKEMMWTDDYSLEVERRRERLEN